MKGGAITTIGGSKDRKAEEQELADSKLNPVSDKEKKGEKGAHSKCKKVGFVRSRA